MHKFNIVLCTNKMLIKNNVITINDKEIPIMLEFDRILSDLESIKFQKKYKNMGKTLALDLYFNNDDSNIIIDLFFKEYLKNTKIPNPDDLLNIFLEKYLTKDSFPLKNKEYVKSYFKNEEIKLSSICSKFYITYKNICFLLYHYVLIYNNVDKNTLISSDFCNCIKITNNNKEYTFAKKNEYCDLLNMVPDEDVGDFILFSEEQICSIIKFFFT